MSQVVEHLAELTGYRDRDVLDVTLVGALRDMFRPSCVAIYRSVGDGASARWLTRAKQRADDPAASADPLWAELESLPLLSDYPLRVPSLAWLFVLAALWASCTLPKSQPLDAL